MPTTASNAIMTTARQTAAAHASALDELECALYAETVIFVLNEKCSMMIIHAMSRPDD
jgi:hypothetical protein